MKKIIYMLMFCVGLPAFAGDCGPGYVLVDHGKIDGMIAKECQKIWCRDLETGKFMGRGDSPANGYVTTNFPNELCDVDGNCIECFGARKWCSGVLVGVWNPEYGAYTRGGVDSATYKSVQKSGCFTWQLQRPSCPAGQDAILKNGEWVCAVKTVNETVGRSSATRRTVTTYRTRMR